MASGGSSSDLYLPKRKIAAYCSSQKRFGSPTGSRRFFESRKNDSVLSPTPMSILFKITALVK